MIQKRTHLSTRERNFLSKSGKGEAATAAAAAAEPPPTAIGVTLSQIYRACGKLRGYCVAAVRSFLGSLVVVVDVSAGGTGKAR